MRLTESARTARAAGTLAKYALRVSPRDSLSSTGCRPYGPWTRPPLANSHGRPWNFNPAGTGAAGVAATIDIRSMKCYTHCMAADLRFMTEVFRIVKAAIHLDVAKVRNYTAFLASKLEDTGEGGAALRLRRLLDDSDHDLRPLSASLVPVLPVDDESRFPLLEKVRLRELQEPAMVLDEAQLLTVREFLSIAKSYAQLEAEGLPASVNMLLYGPPGCGKSRLARHIARDLGLDLYVARLDGLISSYLGSTSKNIRALFEFASRTPCVLFLDEFDAIAKLRADTQELGELKRVVNSFIQNLDTLGTQSVVVAATNHEALLDKAVWRRFDYKVQLNYPGSELRRRLWEEFRGELDFSPKQLAALVDLSDGFSGHEIQEVCIRLHRRRVTQGVAPRFQDLFPTIQSVAIGEGESRRFVAGLDASDLPGVGAALRRRNPKLYSHALLGELSGVSAATMYRWIKGRSDG